MSCSFQEIHRLPSASLRYVRYLSFLTLTLQSPGYRESSASHEVVALVTTLQV